MSGRSKRVRPEDRKPGKADKLRDLVDLIDLGGWPFDALEAVGWHYDYGIQELGAAARAATDPNEAEHLEHTKLLMSEAAERYLAATGERHPLVTRDQPPTEERRAKRRESDRRKRLREREERVS